MSLAPSWSRRGGVGWTTSWSGRECVSLDPSLRVKRGVGLTILEQEGFKRHGLGALVEHGERRGLSPLQELRRLGLSLGVGMEAAGFWPSWIWEGVEMAPS